MSPPSKIKTLGIRLRSAANMLSLGADGLGKAAIIMRSSGFEGHAIEADLLAHKMRAEVVDLLDFIGDKPAT